MVLVAELLAVAGSAFAHAILVLDFHASYFSGYGANMNFNQFGKNLWLAARQKPVDAILYLLVAVVIIKMLSLYFSVGVDDGDWDAFKQAHHCQIQVSSGKQDSGWLCDDGKVYYRWRQQR